MIDELLPNIDELKPITKKYHTFKECEFNKDFQLLPVAIKLQIICDIVRESILPNAFPNPQEELNMLEGNSHTASLVAMEYLKKCKCCDRYILSGASIPISHRPVLITVFTASVRAVRAAD